MVHHGAPHSLFMLYSMVSNDATVDVSSMGQPPKKNVIGRCHGQPWHVPRNGFFPRWPHGTFGETNPSMGCAMVYVNGDVCGTPHGRSHEFSHGYTRCGVFRLPRGTCHGPFVRRAHGITHDSSSHRGKYHFIMTYPTIFHGVHTMEQPTTWKAPWCTPRCIPWRNPWVVYNLVRRIGRSMEKVMA